MGRAPKATLEQLRVDHNWLTENAGPSRLMGKIDHTQDKTRGNINKHPPSS